MTPLSFCVIGGGTGCNAILSPLQQAEKCTFIVPVSDDGGSTAEILRVLGGPALGDIRSRLVRLIPPSPVDSPLYCIRRLFEYRLPSQGSSYEIKGEWHTIVEGSHRLWKGIPGDRKETIRAFLVYFEGAVLKKAQRGFDFKKASIGNLFLSGASLFLGSVPSAIFLFASLTGIPHEAFSVVPVINTSSTVTIAAELRNGSIIAGQSEISHPSPTSHTTSQSIPSPTHLPPSLDNNDQSSSTILSPLGIRPPMNKLSLPTATTTSYFPLTRATTPSFPEPPILGAEEDDDARPMDSPDPNSTSSSTIMTTTTTTMNNEGGGGSTTTKNKSRNLDFSKDSNACPPLDSPIRRIFYLNAFGHEIFPRPNGLFREALNSSTTLVYAPGSLYTSILPCLALRSIGPSIATSRTLTHKILLLNSTLDRETPGYTALDFVRSIVEACERSYGGEGEERERERGWEWKDFVNVVVYLEGGEVTVEVDQLESMGIKTIKSKPTLNGLFDDEVVRDALDRILCT